MPFKIRIWAGLEIQIGDSHFKVTAISTNLEERMEIKFGNHTIGLNHPTYFIADIAANHDGDMERAKKLIRLAKEAGADAAKFQNFDAPKIVSDYGFKSMNGGQVSHQASWKKSVFEVYKGASIPFEWSMTLVEECKEVGIDYFSSPYDFEAIDFLDQYVEDVLTPQATKYMSSELKKRYSSVFDFLYRHRKKPKFINQKELDNLLEWLAFQYGLPADMHAELQTRAAMIRDAQSIRDLVDTKLTRNLTQNPLDLKHWIETREKTIEGLRSIVFENGNMEIMGEQHMKINNERQVLKIEGVIRPYDIKPDNSVLSSSIADARISFSGFGMVADRQKPGWLIKALDWLWPF